MKRFVMVGLAVGVCLAAPVAALEHEVVIDHAGGPIAADYKGSVTVETTQVGAAGVAGRPSTLRCNWTASLNVERVAKVGESLQSRRTLSQDGVASGSKPGWCEANEKAIDKLVDARSESIRGAMLALVEADRAEIVAEAESAASRSRGG